MSGISAAIEVTDLMSPVISNITNALNIMLGTLETTQMATEIGLNAASFAEAREEIYSAESALTQYQEQLERINQHNDIPTPDMPDATNFVWQSSAMPVFTNSGADRFKLEINSVNSSMQEMLQTQAEISQRAMSMTVLPSGAMNDIAGIHNRMQQMQSRIQEINNTPFDLRTDALNNELEILRGKFSQVELAQDQFNAALASGNIEAANASFLRMDNTLGVIERDIRDNILAQEQFNDVANRGHSILAGLTGVAAALGVGVAIKEMVATMYSSAAELEATEAKYQTVFAGMTNTADAFITDFQALTPATTSAARSMASGLQDLLIPMGLARDQATEMTGDTMHLIGALTNFNSATKTAEDVAGAFQSALTGEYESLKALGIQVSESIVKQKAVEMGYAASADAVNNAAKAQALMALAYEQSGDALAAYNEESLDTTTRLQLMQAGFMDSFADAGQAMLPGINNLLEQIQMHMPFIENAIAGVGENIGMIADMAATAFDVMATGAELVADNWSVIEPILLGAAAAIAVYTIATQGATMAQNAARIANEAWTAAQAAFNAVMALNPVYLIVLAVIALVAIIYAVVAAINNATDSTISATGIIMGALAVAGAFIWNTFTGVINGLIQHMWTMFVEPFLGIIEWVLNATQGGFDSFGDAVANLIGNVISWFLSLGKVVTTIIDAIFGTDWTDGLASLQNDVLAWGKNENAITIDRNAPELFGRIEYENAWGAGYGFGEDIEDKFSDFNAGGLLNDLGLNALGVGGMTNDDLLANVNSIANDTSDITDAMDITQEELKYMNDIAEQDAINRFTTAEIKVDLGGVTNQVNNNNDLDGMVDYLAARIEETMVVMAEGVH